MQEQWASAIQTLDMTLPEVVHICRQLTEAELDGLSLDPELRASVESGKVCFRCMKARFSFFKWSYACALCGHAVCGDCKIKVSTKQ